MHTVESLRGMGWKVRVLHHRKYTPEGVNARGGKTFVEITLPDGRDIVGYSRCSRGENFDKKLGVRIALGRALAQIGILTKKRKPWNGQTPSS